MIHPGFTGPVVGQFFGIFKVGTQEFRDVLNAAPFDKTNLLLIAFVHTYERGAGYVVDYENAREGGKPPQPGDDDAARIDRLVYTARKMNPAIKIIPSLGWGTGDIANAAKTPVPFVASVKQLVERHRLDGFDLDYESVYVDSSDLLNLVQKLRAALGEKIMTLTPAQEAGLTAENMRIFDWVMPQTYDHGGNGTKDDWFAETLGGYSKIVLGLNSEGPKGRSDDPVKFASHAKQKSAAGLFAWRLDTDTQVQNRPTFATAIKMWELMHG
jgi:hypothetical protein